MAAILACASGLRRTLPKTMRGSAMSPVYTARPVTFSAASRRGTDAPTALRELRLIDLHSVAGGDPIACFFARAELAVELQLFDLFQNMLEDRTGRESHGDEVAPHEKRLRVQVFSFELGQPGLTEIVIL